MLGASLLPRQAAGVPADHGRWSRRSSTRS